MGKLHKIQKPDYDNPVMVICILPIKLCLSDIHPMTETFLLTVTHNNLEKTFDAELRLFGYSYKISVMVDGTEIIFEPDEERNYRAVLQETTEKQKLPDTELIKAIAGALEIAFK